MNAVVQKEAIKIKLDSNAQFLEGWDLLIKLGYSNENKPEPCPFLYGRADGRISFDLFDPEDADKKNQNSVQGTYQNDPSREVTMVELREMAGPLDGVEKKYPSVDAVEKKETPSLGKPKPAMHVALDSLLATKIGTVFYIPFLDPKDPPKDFIEMLEDMDDSNLNALQDKLNAFKNLFDYGLKINEVAETLISNLQAQSSYPYLLRVDICQNIANVREDNKGKIVGAQYYWNSRSYTWILATDLIDGVLQAKEIGDANLKQHKERLDAELQPNV